MALGGVIIIHNSELEFVGQYIASPIYTFRWITCKQLTISRWDESKRRRGFEPALYLSHCSWCLWKGFFLQVAFLDEEVNLSVDYYWPVCKYQIFDWQDADPTFGRLGILTFCLWTDETISVPNIEHPQADKQCWQKNRWILAKVCGGRWAVNKS